MAEIASVIKSPELSQMSPILLGALGDPGMNNDLFTSLAFRINNFL